MKTLEDLKSAYEATRSQYAVANTEYAAADAAYVAAGLVLRDAVKARDNAEMRADYAWKALSTSRHREAPKND